MILPLIGEQRKTITFLDEKCSTLDTLIAKKSTLLT